MSGDVWAYIGGLREDLGCAEECIRDLEDRCAALERQTPQAQQARREADLAAADLAASGLDYGNLSQECADRVARQVPAWRGLRRRMPRRARARRVTAGRANAYIGTWSGQDVTRRQL